MEEKAKRDSFVFMPFGNGPRNCIGMRFAMMEMKMVLVRMLKEFKLEVCSKTEVRLSRHTARDDISSDICLIRREFHRNMTTSDVGAMYCCIPQIPSVS